MSADERYYFAARYSRHAEMRIYRGLLEEALADLANVHVTSRWIDQHGGALQTSFTPEQLAAAPQECWRFGQADLDDLADASAVVSFTGGGGKGGRHVEYGAALMRHTWPAAWAETQVRMILVGPREHIFHCHPGLQVFPHFDAFLTAERIRFGGSR